MQREMVEMYFLSYPGKKDLFSSKYKFYNIEDNQIQHINLHTQRDHHIQRQMVEMYFLSYPEKNDLFSWKYKFYNIEDNQIKDCKMFSPYT